MRAERSQGRALLLAGLLSLCGLAGCASSDPPAMSSAPPPASAAPSPSSSGSTSSPTPARPRLPPAGGVADYQLGGAYTPAPEVQILTRDSTEQPAAGVYSICYINGFQTQPEALRTWLRDHSELVLTRHGRPVTDENWPDEMLLDTSTAKHRAAILEVIGPVIDRCAAAGFAAVEIDNLDSYTRSGRALSRSDNQALAALFVDRAHGRGLAVAQKNTAEQSEVLHRSVGFDFAVAEECHRWQECDVYRQAYGDQVIDIEYADDLRGTFAQACADPDSPASMSLRDRQLVRRGEPGWVYHHC